MVLGVRIGKPVKPSIEGAEQPGVRMIGGGAGSAGTPLHYTPLRGGGGVTLSKYFLHRKYSKSLPPPPHLGGRKIACAHLALPGRLDDEAVAFPRHSDYLIGVSSEGPVNRRASLRSLPFPTDITGDPWTLRTTKQVAELLGVDPACFTVWRYRGIGPAPEPNWFKGSAQISSRPRPELAGCSPRSALRPGAGLGRGAVRGQRATRPRAGPGGRQDAGPGLGCTGGVQVALGCV